MYIMDTEREHEVLSQNNNIFLKLLDSTEHITMVNKVDIIWIITSEVEDGILTIFGYVLEA